MPDASDNLQGTTPGRLARLLRADEDQVGDWRVNELGAILRHQLRSPLAPELPVPAVSEEPIETFGDLLQHPHPPVQLLSSLKDFAKSHCAPRAGSLPSEVMAVLYYASIVAARLHAHQCITQLSDPELRRGIACVVEKPWIEENTRGLLTEGLAKIGRDVAR
jgi:hypothetical protein